MDIPVGLLRARAESADHPGMGQSKIEISVVGNHGCDRKAKEGEALHPVCSERSCIDCRAREFVAALKAGGNNVEAAVHVHWPTGQAIQDDLLTGTRKAGHF